MISPSRRLRTGVLAVLVATLGAPVLAGVLATSASASVPSMEAQLLALTNSDRAKAHLAPLASSGTLVSIARSWSNHMAATGALGHNPSLASQVSGWSSLGENTAYAWSASQAESAFMASAGHRANILKSTYNRVGIGITKAANGTYWFTVDFEQTSGYHPPATTHPVTHTTTTHHASTTTTRATHAARASRSAVRASAPRAAVTTVSPAVLRSPSAAALDARLQAIDERLDADGVVSLPLPHLLSHGLSTAPDPAGAALVVCGGLLVAAMAGVAVARPGRIRVRGLDPRTLGSNGLSSRG